jgi:hypothetical protein
MTIEALGTGLIAAGVVLALLLGLPLVIGIARLDASNKRLLEYAAQLASRSSRAASMSGPATARTGREAEGHVRAPIPVRRGTLVALGNAIPLPDPRENTPRQLTLSSPES